MNDTRDNWLTVREVTDQQFRSLELARRFLDSAHNVKCIIDFACGTGTNYRYLTKVAPTMCRWVGIDNDRHSLNVAKAIHANDYVQWDCRESPLLVAMTVSGQPIWDPLDALDDQILQCLRDYQRSNHGFGPAAGSDATTILANYLTEQGCEVSVEESAWILDQNHTAMIGWMIQGVARRAWGSLSTVEVDRWQGSRRAQLLAGTLRLTVNHLDLLSLPRA